MSNLIHVSVIITNYNYGLYLARAIRSCLQQSLDENLYEIVVIDDCSTDHSKSIIKNFGKHVKPIFNEKQMGIAYCSNLAIKNSSGVYVIRVDSDDYINYKTLEILLMFLSQNPTYAFAYCDHIVVNEDEGREQRVFMNDEEALINHGAGIMFKKSAIEAVGLYDEEMMNCEDMVLLKTLKLHGYKGIHVQLPLYRYLRHGANMTSDQKARREWALVAEEKIQKTKESIKKL